MYWTLELAISLEDAPWPATKEELIDYATRSGAPMEVIENLQEIEDEGDVYESIEEIWPDYPSKEVEERLIFEKYAPTVILMEQPEKLIKLITEYKFLPNTAGGGWIKQSLMREMGVSAGMALNMMRIRLLDLHEDDVAFARKRLKSIGRYDDERGLI